MIKGAKEEGALITCAKANLVCACGAGAQGDEDRGSPSSWAASLSLCPLLGDGRPEGNPQWENKAGQGLLPQVLIQTSGPGNDREVPP